MELEFLFSSLGNELCRVRSPITQDEEFRREPDPIRDDFVQVSICAHFSASARAQEGLNQR